MKVVKLLKNEIYPTYQLYAHMANKKTDPRDGLRLGALVAMQWLRSRMGDTAPERLQQIPDPSEFRSVTNDCLFSLHINSGFVVDIVSLPKKGIWTLQVTEPDLGSDPGNPEQDRLAVPGRIMKTNVGFRISGSQLECGFMTAISDPKSTAKKAPVYRLAMIRTLIDNPDFGLKQITPLIQDSTPISTADQLKNLLTLWRSEDNQMPCVIFTHARQTEKAAPPPMPALPMGFQPMPLPKELPPMKPTTSVIPPDYDHRRFARSCTSFCRVYLLAGDLLERLDSDLKTRIQSGDIVILEPPHSGCRIRTLSYKQSKQRREETLAALKQEMLNYTREKPIAYGNIAFLSAAREDLIHSTKDALNQSQQVSDHWRQRIEHLKTQWEAALQEKDADYQAITKQLDRSRQYTQRLEAEKDQLQRSIDNLRLENERKLQAQTAYIECLERKLSQPTAHADIAKWAAEHFGGKLYLHPKAVALLEDKSARNVDIRLICDALDFLATDYWDHRYKQTPKEEMLSRCSRKYGRPFDISPVGSITINYTPSQYRIKYFPGNNGKPLESDLNCHLKVGNDPENLLRIYFLHDDEKQLIVIGSLPHHLRAVSIK